MRQPRSIFLASFLLVLSSCGLEPGLEDWQTPVPAAQARPLIPRDACASSNPDRSAFFGDLHVHTGVSMDARVMGTTTTPDDAYRFARGEEIGLSPFAADGTPARKARLDRPLDFAAVTDHAEWMAETSLCTDSKSEVYDTKSCRLFRGDERAWYADLIGLRGFRANIVGVVDLDGRNEEVCDEDGERCRGRIESVWAQMQATAERHYDRSSACTFTTFHAWEYSRSTKNTKIHRNVILRNEIAPTVPFSWIDTPNETELRRKLRDLCLDTESGCDAIAIPHNPNLSNGHQFSVWYRDLPIEEQRAEAALRARLEPIVEMMQVKGESECRNGMYQVLGGPDELCGFEKLRDSPGIPVDDCEEGTGYGAQASKGCTSRLDYVRYALIEGLREDARIDVNPYKFGMIGSTDTHRGTPGATAERDFIGKFAENPTSQLTIGESIRSSAYRNPGGLAGLWAEENTRDALFDAMKRREAFATSGTRIAPRFFGGWNLSEDLCSQPDFVARAYAEGVPMGADLPESSTAAAAPTFVAAAMQDPGTPENPGVALQRIQIVKGWVGEEGAYHQAVYDVAGDRDNGADVDLATCNPRGAGARSLCTVWSDPDFDASTSAVYYARVLENPSCRWSTVDCLALPESERPNGCDDPRVRKTVQERAWTSPIWYEPSEG
jgi:hypothetical protein